MILPYSPAGLPAVGVLGQGEQLLGRVEVSLVNLGDHLLAGRHSCHQDVSVLLEPVPVDDRASHSVVSAYYLDCMVPAGLAHEDLGRIPMRVVPHSGDVVRR